MLKSLFKRIKSQKGMSGVLVALLLVIVGVGLVAGIGTFMKNKKDAIQTSAGTAIDTAITSSNNAAN
jgi:Flp pilus assembly pilin Flp